VCEVNTCKTCKYWETKYQDTIYAGESGWLPCGNVSFQKIMQNPSTEGRDFIYTSPDFGCIHHEPKA
jgi:hypothetical protein